MTARDRDHQVSRREAEIPGPQEETADERGQGSEPGESNTVTEMETVPPGCRCSVAVPGHPHLTLVVAVCVAGIDKLLQALCLPGNVQEQSDGVVLPIVQIEHGF